MDDAGTTPPLPEMPQLPPHLAERTANVRYIYLDDEPLPGSFKLHLY